MFILYAALPLPLCPPLFVLFRPSSMLLWSVCLSIPIVLLWHILLLILPIWLLQRYSSSIFRSDSSVYAPPLFSSYRFFLGIYYMQFFQCFLLYSSDIVVALCSSNSTYPWAYAITCFCCSVTCFFDGFRWTLPLTFWLHDGFSSLLFLFLF